MSGSIVSINVSADGGVPKHPVDLAMGEEGGSQGTTIGSGTPRKQGTLTELSVFSRLRVLLPFKVKDTR